MEAWGDSTRFLLRSRRFVPTQTDQVARSIHVPVVLVNYVPEEDLYFGFLLLVLHFLGGDVERKVRYCIFQAAKATQVDVNYSGAAGIEMNCAMGEWLLENQCTVPIFETIAANGL